MVMGSVCVMDRSKYNIKEIAVCVKPIYDPSIVFLDPEGHVEKDDLFPTLNHRDLLAVEEAVKLKEDNLVESVTVLSVASSTADGLLRRCLAIGADRVVRIWDNVIGNIYTDAAGSILARAIGYFSFKLILCGSRAADMDMGFSGYVIADHLKIPFLNNVLGIELSTPGIIRVLSKIEGGNREIVEAGIPVVIGVEEGINEPRYASLPSLISSLRKPIEQIDLKTIGLMEKEVASNIHLSGFSHPRPRPKKLFVPDSNISAVERLRLIMAGGIADKTQDLFEGSPEEWSHDFVRFINQISAGDPQ